MALEKEISKIKMLESNRGEKEMVEENLNFAYDSVKIEENKEVLPAQAGLDAYL